MSGVTVFTRNMSGVTGSVAHERCDWFSRT
jgi:hypothetical protein